MVAMVDLEWIFPPIPFPLPEDRGFFSGIDCRAISDYRPESCRSILPRRNRIGAVPSYHHPPQSLFGSGGSGQATASIHTLRRLHAIALR
jgi:hypothetical protein